MTPDDSRSPMQQVIDHANALQKIVDHQYRELPPSTRMEMTDLTARIIDAWLTLAIRSLDIRLKQTPVLDISYRHWPAFGPNSTITEED